MSKLALRTCSLYVHVADLYYFVLTFIGVSGRPGNVSPTNASKAQTSPKSTTPAAKGGKHMPTLLLYFT